MKRLAIIYLTIILFYSIPVYGQRTLSNEPKVKQDTEKLADISLQEGKFEKALLLYRNLLETNSQSSNLNFLVGYCYLNTDYGLEQAIEYLKKAIELAPSNKDDLPLEAHYYLAKAYHQNNQYTLALEVLDNLLTQIPSNNEIFKEKANRLRSFCENAKMISQTSAAISIENTFELNSKYSDINPLFFNDDKEVIFTSRRENSQFKKKLEDDQFDENIYYSKFYEDEWSSPYGLSKSINTSENESACWISADGKQIILRRMGDNQISTILTSKYQNGEWTAPETFPNNINVRSHQSFGSISPDGKWLFFTSDKKGGFGGTDIYISENKGNNIWGTPKNMGPAINTLLNEESPVLHENGVLLFCSEGHTSMGGFDIFSSYQDNTGNWRKAFNLGLPLNSIEDDFFYQVSPNGQTSYSSSERSGTKGKSDIYKMTLSDSTGNGFALVLGKLVSNSKIEMDKNIGISFKNEKTNKVSGPFKPNIEGIYNFTLPANANYLATFSYGTNLFYSVNLSISKSISFLCVDQSLILSDIILELDENNIVKTNPSQESVKQEIIYSQEKSTNKIKLAIIQKSEISTKIDSTLIDYSDNQEDIDNNQAIQSDSIYSIMIANSNSRIALSTFKVDEQVNEFIDTNGKYIYYIGEYNYEWEAEIQLRQIKVNYPSAAIFVNKASKKLSN